MTETVKHEVGKRLEIRKATLKDPNDIADLINSYAKDGLMLPRALNDIYEDLRDFFVCSDSGGLVGCGALHICWGGLGEIRSLAVREDAQSMGVGQKLVLRCISEARELGMEKVFTLTFEPGFFSKFGFEKYPKENLPHKIWSDCLRCPHFPNCDETAMILNLTACRENDHRDNPS